MVIRGLGAEVQGLDQFQKFTVGAIACTDLRFNWCRVHECVLMTGAGGLV